MSGSRLVLGVGYHRAGMAAQEPAGTHTLLGHLKLLLPSVRAVRGHPGIHCCDTTRDLERATKRRECLLLLNPQDGLVATVVPAAVGRRLTSEVALPAACNAIYALLVGVTARQ